MTNGVKKGLKIGGIVIAAIILLMIVVPFLFKGKIKEAVVEMANEQLNAKVEIADFGLNLFSNFPNATLSIDGVVLSGVDDFENDTLVQAKSASVTIDLFSLFGDNYKITKIDLDNASVYAKVLKDGRANWDIVKTDSTETVVEEVADDSPFNLNLKKITIKNCTITYDDLEGGMKAILAGWNGTVSGDFSASETTIKTSSVIDGVSIIMDGVPMLSKVKFGADATLNADLENMKFTFIDSKLQLNELKASIDGFVAMIGEEDMDMDLKLNAPDVEFKSILSLLPAMYTNDFKNVKTAGTVSLAAMVKGMIQGDNYPMFDVKLDVKDAMFQYPSLPKSVNNININVAVNSKGGSLDNTIVDVSKLAFDLGGSPFSAGLNVTTPISDANIKAHANGSLDLGMIKDVYPLEKGMELNGKVLADIKLATSMSYIEKELYDKISATGHLKLNNMVFKSNDMQDVHVDNVAVEFTPRYVNLASLDVKIGKNDISANGRLENFIAYALKDQTLKGQLNIKSNYLNANDFMGGEEVVAQEADTTTIASEDIIIPKNLNLALNANLKQIVYDKISITSFNGAVTVRDGILSLNNVSANALGGSCKITGAYNTSDPKTPKVNFGLNLTKVSFAETFKSVETIQKLAPIFENMTGSYSMNLNFNTMLGATTDETLKNLSASGALNTNDVKIENVEILNQLATALKNDNLKTISPNNLNIPFTVDNGRMATKPFDIKLGNGGNMKLEGTTGLDQTIDYKGKVTLPKSLNNEYIKDLGITIGGTFSKPKVGLDTKSLVSSAVNVAAEKLLGESIDTKKEELSAKLNEEKAKQAQKLRDEAQKASDRLVKAAEEQALKLEEKAGDKPLAKAAAKKAGQSLVIEAKKQGDKLVQEADAKIKEIEAEK